MKVEINQIPLIHPTTIVVVGTQANDQPNFTTIGDIAVAGLNPALVMISLNENHQSTKYILKHHRMTINMTEKSMIKEVDFAGIHSSKDTDKSLLFKHKIIDGLPVINKSPITLFCDVLEYIKIKQRMIFVCSVTKTLIDDKYFYDNKIDLLNIQPILYGLDNNYYSGITKIGQGYKEGK